MLIYYRKILTNTLKKNILPAIWTSCSPVKLIHKTNHHNGVTSRLNTGEKIASKLEAISKETLKTVKQREQRQTNKQQQKLK